MKIALLTHAFPPETGLGDDAGTRTWLRARALAERGHDVHVFAGSAEPRALTLRDDRITVTRHHRDDALRRRLAATDGLGAFAAAVRDGRDVAGGLRAVLAAGAAFDVVECGSSDAVAGLLAAAQGLPVVVRVEDDRELCTPAGLATAGGWLARAALARLLREARGAIVASDWFARELGSRRPQPAGPIFVVPPIADPHWRESVDAHGSGRRIAVLLRACDGGELAALGRILVRAFSAEPELRATVVPLRDGSGAVAELFGGQLAGRLDPAPRAGGRGLARAIRGAVAAVVWGGRPTAELDELLVPMAIGVPLLASESAGAAEMVRPGIDGALCNDADVAAAELVRLLRRPEVGSRLAREARARVDARHAAAAVAEREETALRIAAGRVPAPSLPAVEQPSVLLGPDNWFEAWWLRDTAPVATTFALGDDGRPTLLGLRSDDLRYVESVLVRAFCDGPRDWSSPDWHALQRLRAMVLALLAELHERGGGETAGTPLGMPTIDDPLFRGPRAEIVLAELWRRGDDAATAAWLERETRRRGFLGRAREELVLRMLAVECARRSRGVHSYDVVRRIYRDRRWHDAVLAADRTFLDAHPHTPLRGAIAELGLHAPLSRDGFPKRRYRQRAPSADDVRMTVLIPSYRHERFVADAVKSCLSQTLAQVRVLVNDDRSPDGTVDAARAIRDPRLEVRVNETNLGLGSSVLAALATIDTPYVALLNSDDLFHPERLERTLAVLDGDPEAGLVATGFDLIDAQGAVLTSDNACLVEDGPQAFHWLRWFAGITAGFERDSDWTSFGTLLRHNVLATSSNMVFRTDYLRQHMPAARSLKYCVDWQLFLVAAVEDRLRYVPDSLLGYRFHDSNTVWFREGGRGDYVLEVNRVVDTVLRHWLQRQAREHGPTAAATALSELLRRDVLHHGETDGAVLYATALASALGTGGAPVLDPAAAPVDALAAEALRRKSFDRIAERVAVDPWRLPWLAEQGARLPLARDVAHRLGERSRDLEQELERVAEDRARLRERADDAVAARRAQGAELQQAQSALQEERRRGDADRAHAERVQRELADRLDARDADFGRARAEADEARGQLAARTAELAALTRQEEQARRDIGRLEAELGTLRGEHERESAARADLAAQLDRLVAEHRELQVRRAALEERVVALDAERMLAERRESDARRVAGHVAARLRARIEAERRENVWLRNSPAWRLGHSWLDWSPVLRIFKTLDDVLARLAVRVRRSLAHAGRLTSPAGRARQRIVVAAASSVSQPGAPVALEAATLAAAGFDVRFVAWGAFDRAVLGDAERNVLRRGSVLTERASLARADERYFARRVPTAVRDLREAVGAGHPFLGRCFRFARQAKTWGAGLCIAHGLDASALQVWAARRLAGVEFALVLSGHSAADRSLDAAVAERILADAAIVATDSDAVLEPLRRALAGSDPAELVRRPPLHDRLDVPRANGRGRLDAPRLLVVWPTWARSDGRTLVAAVAQLVAQRLDVQVDVVGAPRDSDRELENWATFRDAVEQHGLGGRFVEHGERSWLTDRELLARADLVVWSGVHHSGAGVPTGVVLAAAAGRPLVATAIPPVVEVLEGLAAVSLVPPGNVAALASAIARLAGDGELRGRRADAALAWFGEHLEPAAGSRGFHAAIRAVLGGPG
ncbi:MAG: glycosyltransferase [Planctomycetes bacterium]|nr:glycosyltransferase [Planctomycetota bacterium]